MDLVDKINRTWRPFVGWTLGLSLFLLPLICLSLVVIGIDPVSITSVLAPTYAVQATTWSALAGIRQFGKNREKISEVQKLGILKGIPVAENLDLNVDLDEIVIPDEFK